MFFSTISAFISVPSGILMVNFSSSLATLLKSVPKNSAIKNEAFGLMV